MNRIRSISAVSPPSCLGCFLPGSVRWLAR